MDTGSIAVSLLVGLCAAAIAFTNRSNYSLVIDRVESDLRDRLRSLRITTPHLRRWINIWLGIVAALFFILWLGANSLPVAVLVAPVLLAGPWYVIRRVSTTRRQKIEDQLADAMVMFSSAIRAGLSLAQALELLANDCPKPIHQEFQQIIGEYKLGKPLERTLNEAKERLRSENFILFAAALLASRESGGRLNETVERISKSVVEIQRLERKVRSETASGSQIRGLYGVGNAADPGRLYLCGQRKRVEPVCNSSRPDYSVHCSYLKRRCVFVGFEATKP